MKPDDIKQRNQAVDIYFLGSGFLAVPILQTIVKNENLRLVGIGTQPDRPAGRRKLIQPTLVGEFCAERNLDVAKPVSVNEERFLQSLREKAPELLVTAAFGQLLRRPLLELPACGCLNVHAGLLPRHRGAAPVNAAILEGDAKAGVTFMKMDAGLDTGPVYEMFEIELTGRETAADLQTQLAALAAENIGDCIWKVCRSGLRAVPQNDADATYAPKLRKEDGKIDWTRSATEIERQVRGLIPWPRAYFFVETAKRKLRIQLIAAEVIEFNRTSELPGSVLQASKDTWITVCGVNALRLLRIIPEGRKEMDAVEFLRGCSLPTGTILE